jgi:hypothetical protein
MQQWHRNATALGDLQAMSSLLKRFCQEDDGAVAVIIALMLFVLLGFAAAAIDMSYANSTRTELQVTASAAALAGVQQIMDDDDDGVDDTGQYRRGAVEYIYRNMVASRHGSVVQADCGTYDAGSKTVSGDNECSDVKVGFWNPSTRIFTPWDDAAWDPLTMVLDAVRVRAHRSQENANPLRLFLAPAVGLAEQDINVSATAWAQGYKLDFCMIALDPSASQSLHIEGNATIASDGCGICVNSNSPGGLWLNGTPNITVDAADVMVNASDYHIQGAASIFPSPTLDGGSCTDPLAGANPFAQQLADTSCAEGTQPATYNGGDFGSGPVHIAPGLHCGGIRFNATGDVVFDPGIHHIKNGMMIDRGNHNFYGEGVTFLIDNATIDFAGSQDVELSGGAVGAGNFLFYENPNGPHPTEEHIFRGDADAKYRGYFYAPSRDIKFVGNSFAGGTPPVCFALIANTFDFRGTSDLQLSADGCGGELEVNTATIRLVD